VSEGEGIETLPLRPPGARGVGSPPGRGPGGKAPREQKVIPNPQTQGTWGVTKEERKGKTYPKLRSLEYKISTRDISQI
jgi:hypothetical protein